MPATPDSWRRSPLAGTALALTVAAVVLGTSERPSPAAAIGGRHAMSATGSALVMFAPTQTAEVAARYTDAMAPLSLSGGFGRARAQAAIVRLVRDLEAAHQPPAAIIESAVELLPPSGRESPSIWAMSLRDWVRTTARETLAGPVPDRRHEHRFRR